MTGKRVLVIGAGPIGCLIRGGTQCRASELVASDLSPRCLELARQMGATAVMDPRDEEQVAHYQQHKGYFDVVFEASGAPIAVASSVDFTALPALSFRWGWAPAR